LKGVSSLEGPASPAGEVGVEIRTQVYRHWRPKDSPFFRLVSGQIDAFLAVYPERVIKEHGPLRPVVERVLRAFIACGDVADGFARAWCSTCRTSYLVPYSCRGRNSCPSCEKAVDLVGRVAPPEVLEPLLGRRITPGAVTYDLRRLRLHGLIRRIPRTHRYQVTVAGLRYALFFTRSYDRLLRQGSRSYFLTRWLLTPPSKLPSANSRRP
jgi:hypothetical protein